MNQAPYTPDPKFEAPDSRWREAVNQLIEEKLTALANEQAAAEFHTINT